LKEAAALVESALGIHLTLRDSLYRGIYYCTGERVVNDYLLQINDEKSRRHTYPEYGVTLMVNNLAHMDAIRKELTSGRSDPVLLRTIISMEDLPEASQRGGVKIGQVIADREEI
jgi:hypothetical protein